MSARFGIVVVAHTPLASALVTAVRGILQDVQHVTPVDILSDTPREANLAQIDAAITAVDRGHGVLLATDLIGATPANLCVPFVANRGCHLLAGINLPLLLKCCSQWQTESLATVLAAVPSYVPHTVYIRGVDAHSSV